MKKKGGRGREESLSDCLSTKIVEKMLNTNKNKAHSPLKFYFKTISKDSY